MSDAVHPAPGLGAGRTCRRLASCSPHVRMRTDAAAWLHASCSDTSGTGSEVVREGGCSFRRGHSQCPPVPASVLTVPPVTGRNRRCSCRKVSIRPEGQCPVSLGARWLMDGSGNLCFYHVLLQTSSLHEKDPHTAVMSHP